MITDGVKALHDLNDLYARMLTNDMKRLEAAPTDRKILTEALDLAVKLNRRSDAAPLQARLVELLQKDATTSKDDLRRAYVSLSWYDLFAKDFTGTLAAVEAGHKIAPDDLFLETNRAHALLFLGRIGEAEAVYRANMGKKLSATSNLIWEAAILQDFEDLEKAGVTSSDVARIKKIMGSK